MLISVAQLRRVQHTLFDWYCAYGRNLPWRRTRDPYHILVSEIMLQQTQVDRVIPKYLAFLERFPTLADLAHAAPGDVIRAWAGLGYNRRALNLQRTAQAVLSEHGGTFPQTPAELEHLPGIGPYTAGAVACFAFEHDVAFMDTNIRRVIRRVFVGPEDAPPTTSDRDLLRIAETALPRGEGYLWNQAIMELGAMVCTAARPRCAVCPLRPECKAYAAWKAADETVFADRPATPRSARVVAERPAPYLNSNRYFRGRIIATLRDLPPGASIDLDRLGPQVKDDWSTGDHAWLLGIVQGLAADGLLVVRDAEVGPISVALP
jgi:A/G-specific adenine glycosylase